MESTPYLHALNRQLTYLFEFATKITEIDTVAALSGEFRGSQSGGWNTTGTAYEVFTELQALASKGAPLTQAELRHVLLLYTQLAEAGGVYEGLLNTLQVAQLKAYNLWPFQDLVRVRKEPKAIIGPNANLTFRRLAEVATAIGMTGLAKLLEVTFRDDIRNAIAHTDYILVSEGLRLRRRNGGQPALVSNAELTSALQIGVYFFELLQWFQRAKAESFRPGRTVIGRFSDNPPMPWKIELTVDGALSISTKSAGPQTDAAYRRQERINNRLGGRMVTAYVGPDEDVCPALLSEISDAGFEVAVVNLNSVEQYVALSSEIDEHKLWASTPIPESLGNGFLVATPFGFRRVSNSREFHAGLPAVEEVEFANR